MRTRVRTDVVYQYDELSEKAREMAHQTLAQLNLEWLEPDDLSYSFGLYLEERGFPKDDIRFSLSYSQGDGVAFYGTIDVGQYLKFYKKRTKYAALLRNPNIDMSFRILGNDYATYYSHAHTMYLQADFCYYLGDPTPRMQELMANLEDELREAIVSVSHELERMGYAELSYITSEEYIREQCEANEYEFTEDGRLT